MKPSDAFSDIPHQLPPAGPEDLATLRGSLRLIEEELSRKANCVETTWEKAEAAERETAALLERAADLAEKVIVRRATSLAEVKIKLDVWHEFIAGSDDGDVHSPSSRLIRSLEADLAGLGVLPQE